MTTRSENIVQLMLQKMEMNSTDMTPSKLRGGLEELQCGQVEEVLSAAYSARMKRRGIHCAIDASAQERIGKVSRWLVKRECTGLVLYGMCGTGKTTLVMAISDLLKIGRGSEDLICITATQIMDWFRDEGQRPMYDRLMTVPVLLMDDIGCEPERMMLFGTAYEPIREILYRRYDKMRITVITTNLGNEQLKARYGIRIADRITEAYDTVTFRGDSFRARRFSE